MVKSRKVSFPKEVAVTIELDGGDGDYYFICHGDLNDLKSTPEDGTLVGIYKLVRLGKAKETFTIEEAESV